MQQLLNQVNSTVTLPNILENLAGRTSFGSADLSASAEQSFTGSGSSNQSNSLTGLVPFTLLGCSVTVT